MAGTRLGRIGLAYGLLLLLAACADPAPSGSSESSVSPSPSQTATDGLDTTIVPATPAAPTPPVEGAADVLIAVDDAHISYAVQGCPVAAWLDDAIEDDINFGTFPEYLTTDDGTRWSTHMAVLRIVNGSVTDWTFRLTTPLSGIPGDTERSLVSLPEADNRVEFATTPSQAIFTTGFWDAQAADDVLLPGTVSVTCR